MIIEIQDTEKPEGIFCTKGLEVRICDEGSDSFLAIKCRNLEPTEDYDENTVTLERTDIEPLCKALEGLLEKSEETK